MLADAKFFKENGKSFYDPVEIISRAAYYRNVLYGNKTLSAFEMARGYTPAIVGLSKQMTTQQIKNAQNELAARRALKALDKQRSPVNVLKEDLFRDREVYYFKRDGKFGKWYKRFVHSTEDHIINISSKKTHKGAPIRAAYEDVRLVTE